LPPDVFVSVDDGGELPLSLGTQPSNATTRAKHVRFMNVILLHGTLSPLGGSANVPLIVSRPNVVWAE
jgi:hypothetical protein